MHCFLVSAFLRILVFKTDAAEHDLFFIQAENKCFSLSNDLHIALYQSYSKNIRGRGNVHKNEQGFFVQGDIVRILYSA